MSHIDPIMYWDIDYTATYFKPRHGLSLLFIYHRSQKASFHIAHMHIALTESNNDTFREFVQIIGTIKELPLPIPSRQ